MLKHLKNIYIFFRRSNVAGCYELRRREPNQIKSLANLEGNSNCQRIGNKCVSVARTANRLPSGDLLREIQAFGRVRLLLSPSVTKCITCICGQG